MNQQRFLEQLQIVLDPKKGDVKQATSILQNEYYKLPQSLLFLIQLIISHDSPDLKQLAATQARPLVSKHWTKIPTEQRKAARTQLLQSTVSEESSLTRHSASRLVGSIAKIDLDDGEWSELPGFLVQAATSSTASERSVGVYLLFSILEAMGDGFQEKFKDLFQLFGNTIRDPESMEVRIYTMLALSKMAMVIDAEEDQASRKAFQAIFPSMVGTLKDAIGEGNEERVMLAFEVFQNLLAYDYQLMAKHFTDLVAFMNEIATNKQMPEDTRVQAISFLMQCITYRRLKIQGSKMGEPLTHSMLQVITELDDDLDDDEITPARSALGVIDIMAQQLPPSQVVVPLLKELPQYSQSKDPAHRQAGIMALGMAVEGAPDFVSSQMTTILPILFTLLGDREIKVRKAALQTTARLADDLPEDMGKAHERLMPLLVKNLSEAMSANKGEEEGPTVDMMRSACSAVDSVVDGMNAEDAVPYLDKLAPILQRLFDHPDFKIKALAAGALGSLASTVEEPFLPYLSSSMNAMQDFLTKKESEEEIDLRASVVDAFGEFAVAVGPQNFQSYVRPLMSASEDALHLDQSRLKESTYILWGSLAKVYEADFEPFLEGVVKGLFDCLDQEEEDLEVELGEHAKDLLGKEVTIAGKKVKVAAAADSDDDEVDIEDIEIDEDDDDDWDDLQTVTPIAMEKEIAIEVLGDVVSNTSTAFLKFYPQTIEKLLTMVDHPAENVRKATISTLHRAYAALWEISEEKGQMQKWKPGLPLQVEPSNELKTFATALMDKTLDVWTEEDDQTIVTEISRAIAENLKLTGPALLVGDGVLKKTVETVEALISRKHVCQMDLDEEAATLDIEDMETTEYDWIAIDSAMDIIAGLAVALGPNFTEIWPQFEKRVFNYASSGESLERASACGVLAEVITGLDGAVTPYTSKMMTILLRRLSDEDAQTKSNAAYAVGRLVEKSNDDATVLKAYPTIIQKLEGLLSIKQCRCMDNAAGCIARLILKHRDKAYVPDVLPALVDSGVLPLKEDYQENEPVWKMIVTLYQDQDKTIMGLTNKLAPIMMQALGDPEDQLTDETRGQVQELVDHLKKLHR